MGAPFTYRVASPCTQSWAGMTGDERVRHCLACRKNVFNFSELSRTEIEVLLLKSEGRVCARLYQRKDGTVLTRDCPVGVAKVRRALVGGLTATAALFVGLFAVTPFHARGVSATTLKSRAVQLEERLRTVPVIGALIEKLDPSPTMVMGEIGPP